MYYQYILNTVNDFIFFNGPITVLSNTDKTVVSSYKDVIIKVTCKDNDFLLKAPLYFNSISVSKQKRLIKHTTRKEGIRTGKYIKYEICE